jgi:acyl-CoA synthetase (AMP-forming)/AMP-acid ligase II
MLISNIAIVIKPEDMLRLFKLARPGALLYSSSLNEKVEAIKALCAEHDNGAIANPHFLEVQLPCLDTTTSHAYETGPMSESISSQNGTLFFTSGTSGKQKGVLHSYPALLASAQERIGTWKLTKNDVFLNQKPGNWMGGIFGIIPSLMSGACL